MGSKQLLDDVPVAHQLALILHGSGVQPVVIARCLAVPEQGVAALLVVARAKVLAALAAGDVSTAAATATKTEVGQPTNLRPPPTAL